jgi:mRNA interferase RelE/StbE
LAEERKGYVVLLERRALKQLQSLDVRIGPRVSSALKELNEGFSAQLDIKKLKGMNNRYRVRVGDYRILFELSRARREIVVFAILPRERAYD